MGEYHEEAREILRHIGAIGSKEYRRGWQDAVAAMRAAADRLTKRQPSDEFPMSTVDPAASAVLADDPAHSAQEALATITGTAASVRSPALPAAPTTTADRQDSER
jgi:lysozyme family protein